MRPNVIAIMSLEKVVLLLYRTLIKFKQGRDISLTPFIVKLSQICVRHINTGYTPFKHKCEHSEAHVNIDLYSGGTCEYSGGICGHRFSLQRYTSIQINSKGTCDHRF